MSKDSRTKISIGMPVYNGAQFIREALDSLLEQDFRNFELIISDNGSTDRTEEICREYAAKDSRIRYARQVTNRGPLANFLYVLNESRSEFFMWAAHDDVWDKKWVGTLYECVSVAPGLMAYGQVITVDADGKPTNHPANNRPFRFDQKYAWLRRARYFLAYEGLGKANPIYGLYRRADVLQGVEALSNPYKFADCLFIFDMLASTKLKAMPGIFHHKRVVKPAASGEAGILSRSETSHRSIGKKIAHLARTIFNLEAVSGYVSRTSGLERVLILSLVPVKALFACHGVLMSHLMNRNEGSRL